MADNLSRTIRRRRLRPEVGNELSALRQTVSKLEAQLTELRGDVAREHEQLDRMRAALRHASELLSLRDAGPTYSPSPFTRTMNGTAAVRSARARRSRSEIAESVGAFLRDPELARLPDPEIASRLGVARQTVTNWRRRLLGSAGRARHRTQPERPSL